MAKKNKDDKTKDAKKRKDERQRRLSRAEAERKRQKAAAEELAYKWPLPTDTHPLETEPGYLIMRFPRLHQYPVAVLPVQNKVFSILEVRADDMLQAKNTDVLDVVNNFKGLLDDMAERHPSLSMQILVRSFPRDLDRRVDSVQDRVSELESDSRYLSAARADDYGGLLDMHNREHIYQHGYYITLSYLDSDDPCSIEEMSKAVVLGAEFLAQRIRDLSSTGNLRVVANVLPEYRIKELFADFYDVDFKIVDPDRFAPPARRFR